MRRRTVNVYFSWLVVAMVYYGLSFNTKNIGGNIYLSNFVSGFAEIVACVLIIPGEAIRLHKYHASYGINSFMTQNEKVQYTD
jgi:hypothetical protein